MRVAIPLSDGLVAPILDNADSLLIVDLGNRGPPEYLDTFVTHSSIRERADELASIGVDVVVCDQVSHALENMILAHGIHVLSHVTGKADEALETFHDHDGTGPAAAENTVAAGAQA
jgi:predicted Fe-Mo cluster-binding NifX family protein